MRASQNDLERPVQVSLRSIAKRLDLSVTTVSRALGGFPEVAAATSARVRAEAARIDYRPNQLARRLRHGRSEAIGARAARRGRAVRRPVLPAPARRGRPGRCSAPALDLLVMTARPGAEELRAYRHLIEGRRVDGMLLARTRRDDARIGYLLDRGAAVRRARPLRGPAPLCLRRHRRRRRLPDGNGTIDRLRPSPHRPDQRRAALHVRAPSRAGLARRAGRRRPAARPDPPRRTIGRGRLRA